MCLCQNLLLRSCTFFYNWKVFCSFHALFWTCTRHGIGRKITIFISFAYVNIISVSVGYGRARRVYKAYVTLLILPIIWLRSNIAMQRLTQFFEPFFYPREFSSLSSKKFQPSCVPKVLEILTSLHFENLFGVKQRDAYITSNEGLIIVT